MGASKPEQLAAQMIITEGDSSWHFWQQDSEREMNDHLFHKILASKAENRVDIFAEIPVNWVFTLPCRRFPASEDINRLCKERDVEDNILSAIQHSVSLGTLCYDFFVIAHYGRKKKFMAIEINGEHHLTARQIACDAQKHKISRDKGCRVFDIPAYNGKLDEMSMRLALAKISEI